MTPISGVLPGYWGAFGLLPGCSPACSWDAPGRSWVLFGCSLGAPWVLQGCFESADGLCLGWFRSVLGVFLGCSWGVSGMLLGVFPWVLLGCTWVAPRVFWGPVSGVFLEAVAR